jgi:type IV pilus assembly protein PilC
MEYNYVAYTEDKKMVKGRVSAANDETATNILAYGGYQVVSLKKAASPFNSFSTGRIAAAFSRIKPHEVVMFSRQLALLLESGSDIATTLDLLQSQTANRMMKTAVAQVANDIRGGTLLSTALAKHPRIFSRIYCQAIAAGEQGGNLEIVLRQMADHIERQTTTEKKIKSALTYPIMVAFVAAAVIILLVTFVMPTFNQLYSAFGANLPAMTKALMNVTNWLRHFGLYLLIGLAVIGVFIYAYTRTPAGRYQRDSLILKTPVIGRIALLNELSRCCRTISLLFKVGIPLPEIMTLAIQGANNKVISEALGQVKEELIRGEGLHQPMARRPVFMPLMTQMVGVGEETGNLDNTLSTVAQSYEAESEDRTSAAVGLIQPIITVVIGVVVALIAVSMFSAMYGVYGQINQ